MTTTLDVTTRTWSELHPDPDQPRTTEITEDSVIGLMASIEQRGVLQSVRAKPDGKLVFGHRRHAAVGFLIARKRLPEDYAIPTEVIEGEDEDSDADTLVDQLVENLMREDLDPIDEAKGYFRLIEFGQTQADLVTLIGVSKSHVSKRLALLRLPDEVQAKVSDGTCTIERALALAAIKDPAKQKKLVDKDDRDIASELKAQKTDEVRAPIVRKLEGLGVEVKETRRSHVNLPDAEPGMQWQSTGKDGRSIKADDWKGSIPRGTTLAYVFMDWSEKAMIAFYKQVGEPKIDKDAPDPTAAAAVDTTPVKENTTEKRERLAREKERALRIEANRIESAHRHGRRRLLTDAAFGMAKAEMLAIVLEGMCQQLENDIDIDVDDANLVVERCKLTVEPDAGDEPDPWQAIFDAIKDRDNPTLRLKVVTAVLLIEAAHSCYWPNDHEGQLKIVGYDQETFDVEAEQAIIDAEKVAEDAARAAAEASDAEPQEG